MSKFNSCQRQDVASIAGRVLVACKSGHDAGLFHEVARARSFTTRTQRFDTLEAERMDVLAGALESLAGARPDGVQAAMYVLEHLASQSAQPRSIA